MKVRFLGDYDFNREIVDGLLRRERSIDFLSGFEADLQGVCLILTSWKKRPMKGACLSLMTRRRCRATLQNSSHIAKAREFSLFRSEWRSALPSMSCF
jgi:hypothetical protein